MNRNPEGARLPFIERVIDASARNPVTVLALVGALAVAGWECLRRTPLDALPDLADPQVMVKASWEGRGPDRMEEQVVQPLAAALRATPGVRTVRGISFTGEGFLYAILHEGADPAEARARVGERLREARLPPGAAAAVGPDANGVGWIFQYALVDRGGRHDAADLRTIQDLTLRPALESVEGVAEVASFGGFVREYQVELDPERLQTLGVWPDGVVAAIRSANREAAGGELERFGTAYRIRGRGGLASLDDLRGVVVGFDAARAAPIRLREVARSIAQGPAMRSGAGDFDGLGETPGGIVIARRGERTLAVLDRVKARLEEVRPGLPAGVEVMTTYDRSELIHGCVRTLVRTLAEEAALVAAVVVVLLLDAGGALRAVVTMPLAVLLAFIPMRLLGLGSDAMSLGGLAIALGAMVDEAVVMVENAHKRLEHAPPGLDRAARREIVIAACRQLGRPLFLSLLVITVAFLPVFALESQEGRMFRPLAFTKTFAMAAAALLSITAGPALLVWMAGRRVTPEARHPVSRLLWRLYFPWVRALMRRRALSLALAVAAVASCVPLVPRMGSEYLPAMDEGDLLFMPSTWPTASLQEAVRVMQIQDRLLRAQPEVLSVHGKAGRADTATDPAPMEMFETVVRLKPRDQWRTVPRERWHSGWAPAFLRPALRAVWPETRPVTADELAAEFDRAVALPGLPAVWTQPIRNRIEMNNTGIRAAVGVKVFGPDPASIRRAADAVERALRAVPGARSVVAERPSEGLCLDIDPDREALARLGRNAGDLWMALDAALGAMPVEAVATGRERPGITVRFPRERRDDIEALRRLPLALPGAMAMGGGGGMADSPAAGASSAPPAAWVTLGEVAGVRVVPGPAMARSEDGSPVGWVLVDVAGRDLGGFVREARAAVRAQVEDAGALPPGVRLAWSGQAEHWLRAREKLARLVPLTLALLFALVYLAFRSLPATLIILLSVPFAATGGVWMTAALGLPFSVAVWIGLIAVAGLAAQTGIVMLVYLEEAFHAYRRAGRLRTRHDLMEAITYGAVRRVRPKAMTVLTMLLGLLPLLVSDGPGADVMKRVAAPMVGGLLSSAFLTLELIPAIYSIWRGRGLPAGNGPAPRRAWAELDAEFLRLEMAAAHAPPPGAPPIPQPGARP